LLIQWLYLVIVVIIRPVIAAGLLRVLQIKIRQWFSEVFPNFFFIWLVVQDVSFDPVRARPVDVLFPISSGFFY
jgi:hypothetical protein